MYSIQITCSEKALSRCKKCPELDVEVCPRRKGCEYYGSAEIMKVMYQEGELKEFSHLKLGDNSQ